MYYIPTPLPLSWQKWKWKWQTNWKYWRLHIWVVTIHTLSFNGKVKVANTKLLICLNHNCSQISNWAILMHQDKTQIIWVGWDLCSEEAGYFPWAEQVFENHGGEYPLPQLLLLYLEGGSLCILWYIWKEHGLNVFGPPLRKLQPLFRHCPNSDRTPPLHSRGTLGHFPLIDHL